MTEITLFIAPGSCSRVPTIALCEIGVSFQTHTVKFLKGEHKSPEYKRVNHKGKVPALVIDGEALTENVAILTYLDRRFPEAGLMPPAPTPLDAARQLADLCFCSATLHPLVTRIRMPQMFAAPGAMRDVHDRGAAAMGEYFQLVEDRFAHGDWWYGDRWSAMDAYLHWVFFRVEGAGFDVAPYPRFAAHHARIQQRPAVQRALAIEAAALADLEAAGLAFKPPPLPA